MNRIGLYIMIMIFTSLSLKAQVKTDLIASYTFLNGLSVGPITKPIYPFTAGLNFGVKLTKKEYSPWQVFACAGIRLNKTGYKIKGSVYSNPEYYKNNGVSSYYDTKSQLVQQFVTIPVGFEFRFKALPVTGTKNFYSCVMKVLFNNSFMLSSQLKESIYSNNLDSNLSQNVNLKSHLKHYYPGVTIEFRIFRYFNTGFIYQNISYKPAKNYIDFNHQSASPFYEMIAKNGIYRDFSWYAGVNIPLNRTTKRSENK